MMLLPIPRNGKRPRRTLIAIVLCVAAAIAPSAAQELQARTYSNLPVALNVFGVGYAYSDGNVFMDPALPIEGLESRNHLLFVSYARTFSLAGQSAKLFVMLPGTFRDWQGESSEQPGLTTRKINGLGDARISLSWNFKGAPALSPAEFASYRQRTIVGARLRLVAPTGLYDSSRLFNLGSNRWSINPEIGVSRAVSKWVLEMTGAVWLFTDNDDFVGSTLAQRPLWAVTGHAVRNIRPGFWFGFGVGYGEGGQTEIDEVPRDTRQRNWRFGAVVAYPIAQAHGLRASFVNSNARGKGAEFDAISLAYAYRW